MTREIRVNEKAFQREATSAHTVRHANTFPGKSAKRSPSLLQKVCTAYAKAVRVKREVSEAFVAITEALADKTAREGLFGEDKDKNYCGTSVDYVSD